MEGEQNRKERKSAEKETKDTRNYQGKFREVKELK